jgi:DNA-3-methyladenine glycosylase
MPAFLKSTLPSYQPLPLDFYSRPTLKVARDLLGCRLVRYCQGHRLSGMIVETEAYIGQRDRACHARAGKTPRTAVMFGPAGVVYVYFTYGMHWMLNVITEEEGFPAAVLIRAIEPLEGIPVMQQWRDGKELRQLCNGPAKLTQALSVGRAENGLDLCAPGSPLYIEPAVHFKKNQIATATRIGIGATPEPWLSKPWRFFVKNNPFVSR